MYSLTDTHVTPHNKITHLGESKYQTYLVRRDNQPLATFAPWAFGSCAVHGVYGLYDKFFHDVPGVVEFLLSEHAELTWQPKELYLMLGVHQHYSHKDKFAALPGCKLIDDFDNRAHGGHVYLYRISL